MSPSSPTKRSLSQSNLPKRQSPKKRKKRDVPGAHYLYSDSELSDEVSEKASDDAMSYTNEEQAPSPPYVGSWTVDEDGGNDDDKPSKITELPPSVLAQIASYLIDVPLKKIEECRACGCLGPLPYRCGNSTFSKDPFTESDIRRDPNACALTKRGGFGGGWCLKQYVAKEPGKKRQAPSFAVASKAMWRKWRDATIWVFCCEDCMHTLILGLPKYNSRLITRARFYERNNDIDIDGLSREGYSMRAHGGYDDWLVYETTGNKHVDYRDQKIWAKELVLSDPYNLV